MPRVYRPGTSMKPCLTPLGHFIRTHRLKSGFTQRRVEDLARLTRGTCSKLEEGDRNRRYLDREEQCRLADILQCSAEELKRLASRRYRPAGSELGELIQSRRIALGLTISRLANECALSSSLLNQLERGTVQTIRAHTSSRLQAALHIQPEDLELFLARPRHLGRNLALTTSRLGNLIRDRRLALDLSLQDVADRLGCTRQAVSLIEHGLIPLSGGAKLIRPLARTLGINEDEFIQLCPPRKIHRTKERKTPLSRFLTARRQELRLRQQDVAHLAGISNSLVCQLENGVTQLTPGLCSRFESVLQCRIPSIWIRP